MLLEPEQVGALVNAPTARADVSVLRGCPVIAVDLREGDHGVDLSALSTLPVVAIGAGATHDATDVVVDDPAAVEAVIAAVQKRPHAAVTLVQLLRLSSKLPLHDALVAESLGYATLQGGAEFHAWLARRGARSRPPELEPPIITTRVGNEQRIELNRPRLHNMFNAAMRDALSEVLAALASDPTVERILLSGRGKSFGAGGDLAEFGESSDPPTAHLIRTTANVAPHLLAVASRLHADVHGAVVGAGIEMAAFASHVRATPDAIFQLPEVSMGLMPGAGGTVSIPRRIGRHRAAWLMLTGERIGAARAHEWGLVDEVSPE